MGEFIAEDKEQKFASKFAPMLKPAIIILVLGLGIRFFLMPLFTYSYDVSHWAITIQNIQSGNGLYEIAGYYYSPVWGYILGFLSEIYNTLGLGTMVVRLDAALPMDDMWWAYYSSNITTLQFNVFIKIPLVISDCIIGYLIYWLVKNRTSDVKKATLAFGLWFLCPIVIYSSAVQGMFDTVSVLFMVLAVVLVYKGHNLIAGAIFAIAVLTKLFPAFILFVLAAYVLKKNKDNTKLAMKNLAFAIGGALIAVIIVYAPQIADGSFIDSLYFLTSRASIGSSPEVESTLWGTLENFGFSMVLFIQPVLIGICAYMGYRMYRTDGDVDALFFKYLLISTVLAFIWPPAPPYLLIVIPFLAYHIAVVDKKYLSSWAIMGVGATLYALVMSNASLLLSLSAFTDIISLESVISAVSWFTSFELVPGLRLMMVAMVLTAAIQMIGLWSILGRSYICKEDPLWVN